MEGLETIQVGCTAALSASRQAPIVNFDVTSHTPLTGTTR